MEKMHPHQDVWVLFRGMVIRTMDKIRLVFELMECIDMPDDDITDYRQEFINNHEDCYVLWLLKEMSIRDWKINARTDTRTKYVGMYAEDKLVGIGRITSRLNREASGMIGYAIRPSERGKGYEEA